MFCSDELLTVSSTGGPHGLSSHLLHQVVTSWLPPQLPPAARADGVGCKGGPSGNELPQPGSKCTLHQVPVSKYTENPKTTS